VTTDPGETGDGPTGKADGTTAVPDVQCSGTPDAGPAGDFRHLSSKLVAALGDPRHRGFDLVASASADPQRIEGWASYTIADKALEDEDVDVFACREGAWQPIGTARTDGEGHFSLELSGGDRLPLGVRDLYFSVEGDRTGAEYLGAVLPDAAPLVISDVDGTLTSSENAFFETIVTGAEPDQQPGASDALQAIAAKGYEPVFVTSRGNQYTGDTRQWLADKGFPRAPVRLANSFVTLPGQDTIDYKTQTFTALADGLTVFAGIGNRATDVTAYTNVGLPGSQIFVKLPEYQGELQQDLDSGAAIGFTAYDDLRTQTIVNW
jgi:phosphatidate phosphatase PAH1